MSLFDLMFRSGYDRLSLLAMVLGVAANAAIDLARRGRGIPPA